MSAENQGELQVKSWDEKWTQEGPGGIRMSRAQVAHTWDGVISGEGCVDYVMFYRANNTAFFVGLERVAGTVGGKNGGFVIQHTGVLEAGTAKSSWSVVPGSGTGELVGIGGTGTFVAGHSGQGVVTFKPVFA